MSAAPLPDRRPLDAVATELSRSAAAALDASRELLAHYSDTGGASSQRALDTLIEHAADALRALTDSFADLAGELQTTIEKPAEPAAARRGRGQRR
jgi:ABC-type transporter Mla subunit MlaD